MNRFLVQIKTPKSGTLTMLLGYNEPGELVSWELRDYAERMNEQQRNWLWGFIPRTIASLGHVKERNYAKVTELQDDLSFDAFWELYNYKVGNKKRARKHWDALDDATRALAMQKVREYNFYMAHRTHDKVFPERWLQQERWENEYRI